MAVCCLWPATQHWHSLGPPQISSDPKGEHWPTGAGSQWMQKHTSARREQRWGPPGVSPQAWMSQINNIFRSCLCNYTGSFFQGSSRPPLSLIASASSSHRAPRSCPPSSLWFPWRQGRMEGSARRMPRGAAEPDPSITDPWGPRDRHISKDRRAREKWQGVSIEQKTNGYDKERHLKLASVSGYDALFPPK